MIALLLATKGMDDKASVITGVNVNGPAGGNVNLNGLGIGNYHAGKIIILGFAAAAAGVGTSAFRAACLLARSVGCEREKPPRNAANEARSEVLVRHAEAGPLHAASRGRRLPLKSAN
jgi:hypothetical protein